jgi:tetratricopeptide (TPR) repeat protein
MYMVYSMKRRFCTLIITLLLALSISAWQVNAAGGGGGDDDVDKPVSDEQINFDAGVRAVYAGKYDKAIELMAKVLKDNSKNADAYNYLGFSFRKKGDLKLAASAYKEALDINPDHKGALEYQGEMYLKLGNVSRAKSNLFHLERLCSNGCKELAELKRAIADYAATHPNRGS